MVLGGIGRREPDDADRGDRWTSKGSWMFPSGAFTANDGDYVLRGNRGLKTGYRLNIEP